LKALKRIDEAFESYNKAITLDQNHIDANWNLAILNLLTGRYEDGLKGYEWRWKNRGLEVFKEKRNFFQPLWLGKQLLKDKTILIHAEQGFGDTIQFCRYVPIVAELGAKVIFEVQQSLRPLLMNLKGVGTVLSKGDTLPDFDYQIPLLSLPLALGTTINTIPSCSNYIEADNEKIKFWERKLGNKNKLRVGIVWSGSAVHSDDSNRSLRLSQILPYLPRMHHYISLQKDLSSIDRDSLKQAPFLTFLGDDLNDYSDTAALCELMDLVISVDTSIAHLSGALGKETWILLPYSPDWRWLLSRVDSPWYPSVKLYRQNQIRDWDDVLKKVYSDLHLIQ